MPQLQDSNFRRAVVQVVEHDEEGTFGLILNREVDLTAGALCDSLDLDWRGDPEVLIRWGGPVQNNTGWVLFGDDVALDTGDAPVQQLLPGVCFAGSLGVLQAVAVSPPEDVQLFLGYAGWGPGQLEAEIAAGSWLIAPSSPDVVFAEQPDAMWRRVLAGMGIDPATLVATSGVH